MNENKNKIEQSTALRTPLDRHPTLHLHELGASLRTGHTRQSCDIMPLKLPARYQTPHYTFSLCNGVFSSRNIFLVDTVEAEDSMKQVRLQLVFTSFMEQRLTKDLLCEIKLSGKLRHDNLLPFIRAFFAENAVGETVGICLLFPTGSSTLYDVIQYSRVNVTHGVISKIGYQLLNAINYIHCCGCVLVNLPLKNIVLDQNHNLKLQDFGWKYAIDTKLNILANYIRFCFKWNSVSLLAPELLAHSRSFDGRVDTWTVGCILAMLLTQNAFQQGTASISCGIPCVEMLVTSMRILGKPNDNFLTNLPKDIKKFIENHAIHTSSKQISTLLETSGADIRQEGDSTAPSFSDAENLISKLLVYPENRLTSEQAMRHCYFTDHFSDVDLQTNQSGSVAFASARVGLTTKSHAEAKTALHGCICRLELQRPVRVCSLKEMCMKIIETEYDLEYLSKIPYPPRLLQEMKSRVVSGFE